MKQLFVLFSRALIILLTGAWGCPAAGGCFPGALGLA
jgi:hypothetical protein